METNQMPYFGYPDWQTLLSDPALAYINDLVILVPGGHEIVCFIDLEDLDSSELFPLGYYVGAIPNINVDISTYCTTAGLGDEGLKNRVEFNWSRNIDAIVHVISGYVIYMVNVWMGLPLQPPPSYTPVSQTRYPDDTETHYVGTP